MRRAFRDPRKHWCVFLRQTQPGTLVDPLDDFRVDRMVTLSRPSLAHKLVGGLPYNNQEIRIPSKDLLLLKSGPVFPFPCGPPRFRLSFSLTRRGDFRINTDG